MTEDLNELEGGIAPLVAAKYAAEAVGLIYDLLPEKAQDWVDENLGVNWAKRNIAAPLMETALDIKERLFDPDYERKKQREEGIARAEAEDAKKEAEGWKWTEDSNIEDYYERKKTRVYYQAFKDGKFWWKYNPLTGEMLNKWTDRADQIDPSLKFDTATKEFTQVSKKELYGRDLASETPEERAANDAKLRAAETTYQENLPENIQKRKEEEWRKQNEEYDRQQQESNDAARQDQEEQEAQMRPQGEGHWSDIYGRTGFHAGLGYGRPLNSKNIPVLNLSRSDKQNFQPVIDRSAYWNGRDKQIVLWNDDYSHTLTKASQLSGIKKKFGKREKNKLKYDRTDIHTLTDAPRGDFASRGERREALAINPFDDQGRPLSQEEVTRRNFARLNAQQGQRGQVWEMDLV